MGIRMALGADRGEDSQFGGVARHDACADRRGHWRGRGVRAYAADLRFLFGVKIYDPMVFVTVPVILSAVALAAVWFPATASLEA